MEKEFFDIGQVFDTTRLAWRNAMTEGGPFGIADALGADHTLTLLNSRIGGISTLQGAIAGIVDALAEKPEEIQRAALEQDFPFKDSAGFHVSTRDIGVAGSWIAGALASKRSGSDDPVDSVAADIAKEIFRSEVESHLQSMTNLLAAVTLVGAIASFPDDPPTNLKSVIQMDKIAEAAESGTVTAQTIQIIINEGATLNLGGIHGDNASVVQGNGNNVASGEHSSVQINNPSATTLSKTETTAPFWKNIKFYQWAAGFTVAVLTLYVGWLTLVR